MNSLPVVAQNLFGMMGLQTHKAAKQVSNSLADTIKKPHSLP